MLRNFNDDNFVEKEIATGRFLGIMGIGRVVQK